jgi:hypothetical protein
MKQCRYCKKLYPESYFGVALTTETKVYYRHKCKFCYQLTKRELRKKNQNWLLNFKKEGKCSMCNNEDYRALEFHHINSKQKDFSISYMRNNSFSLEKMKEEIKKCVILCANCHRITHWQENSW